MILDRRDFVRSAFLTGTALYLFPQQLFATEGCDIGHPLMPPNKNYTGVCHNCGMIQSMWARTWHTYEQEGEHREVCSMHCLAESTTNSGKKPEKVQAALYVDPDTTVAGEQVWYVVGSSAPGTMTMKSKLAFATKEEAEAFSGKCGGEVVGFSQAYAMAATTIAKENQTINRNRIAKKKIVEPVDNQDICPVCNMLPAKYPKNKCQILTAEGEVIHFCCTQCLFSYLKNHQQYGKPELKISLVWAIDYDNGEWIYAKNAYYVLGTDVPGPMGKEAYPFFNGSTAEAFAIAHKGKVMRFGEVSIDHIMG